MDKLKIGVWSVLIIIFALLFAISCDAFVKQEETLPTTTTVIITTTTTEVEPTTIEYVELGTYRLTAYCPCSSCCGKSDGITASGTKAQEGRTIAASNQFSFGTRLLINGNIYTVEDRGNFAPNTIDIYMDSHSDALNFGVQYAKVYEVIE